MADHLIDGPEGLHGAELAPAASARLGRQGKGLTHELVEALGGQLRSRAIKPGDKLPAEAVIMQTFGISRGVVREALSRLQAAGLVQTHHGIGTFALEPSPQGRFQLESPAIDSIADMLEMLELRTSIESDAAGLAAVRRNEDHLRDMRSALDDFAKHLAAVGETVAPDFRFHLAIAQATGNRYYGDLMGQLGLSVIPRTRVSSSWLDVEQRAQHLQKVNQEHQDIFAAIERRDPEAARAAMRIHLVNSRERQRVAHAEQSASDAVGRLGAPGRGDR
jgi:GntR family transcriptional repressor for pyruvate dehydrogenase complex